MKWVVVCLGIFSHWWAVKVGGLPPGLRCRMLRMRFHSRTGTMTRMKELGMEKAHGFAMTLAMAAKRQTTKYAIDTLCLIEVSNAL